MNLYYTNISQKKENNLVSIQKTHPSSYVYIICCVKKMFDTSLHMCF